jgi:hypothetical protein
MKKLILGLPILLIACGDPDVQLVTKEKLVPVVPAESMYVCPTVRSFPETKTLTDIQVARLIAQLHSNNMTCKNSIEAIKKYVSQAKERLERHKE